MARRLFNGNAFSENGWPYVDEGSCTWIVVPGTDPEVRLQIQNGPPLTIMRAFAADINAYIEHVTDPDSACWTPGNSVATSNHPGGTAMDIDWERHPFQKRNTFNPAQQATVRELLDWYEGNIFWGGDWDSPVDEMHWQMGYETYDKVRDQPFPKVQDFINRKIRADGFSTFRRGGMPVPPPVSNVVDVLVRATGITVAKAQQIMPTVLQGLRLSECTNVNRIAMWLAQIGHESGSFVYTEEIQSGDESTDRWLYKGRTWIQITWRTNYAQFSQWLFSKGLISSPTYFVDHPKELAQQQWAGIGPAWYWTVARPQINSLCDKRDLFDVTQAINGGQNGAADRKRRYDMALMLGDQLLALVGTSPPPPLQPSPGEDDFLSALTPDEQRALFNAVMNQRESRSPLRHLGEGTIGDTSSVTWNIDGSVHVLVVQMLAMLRNPGTIALLQEVANADPTKFPDRQEDRLLAQAILSKVPPSGGGGSPAPPASSVPAVIPRRAAAVEESVEVLPAVVSHQPVQNTNTPEALLETLDRLDQFDQEYRKRFNRLTDAEKNKK